MFLETISVGLKYVILNSVYRLDPPTYKAVLPKDKSRVQRIIVTEPVGAYSLEADAKLDPLQIYKLDLNTYLKKNNTSNQLLGVFLTRSHPEHVVFNQFIHLTKMKIQNYIYVNLLRIYQKLK